MATVTVEPKRRKTKADHELDSLLVRLDPTYVRKHASELAAQGFDVPVASAPPVTVAEPDDSENEEDENASDSFEVPSADVGDMGADESNSGYYGALDEDAEAWYARELGELQDLSEQLADADDARRAADRLKRDEPESREAIQQQLADLTDQQRKAAVQAAQGTAQLVSERMSALAGRVGGWRTPGGLGVPALLLLVLLLFLVPVNGEPRFVWLWLVLTGRANLKKEADALPIATAANAAALANAALAGAGAVVGSQIPGSGALLTAPQAAVAGAQAAITADVPGLSAVVSAFDVAPGLSRYLS